VNTALKAAGNSVNLLVVLIKTCVIGLQPTDRLELNCQTLSIFRLFFAYILNI